MTMGAATTDPRRAADALVRAGRMNDAIAVLRAAAERAPADPSSVDVSGWNPRRRPTGPTWRLSAWERAALAFQPSAPAATGRQGRALQALARPEEAQAAFEAALAAGDRGPEARYGLALLAFDTADYETAAAHARRLPARRRRPAWLKARIDLAGGNQTATSVLGWSAC